MNKSAKLFYDFFVQSLDELKKNFKIYLMYFICLILVFIVQYILEIVYFKDDFILKIISKILFSIIPILISSKILYIIKIRQTGIGEYKTIVWRYLTYNIYYFCLVLLSAALYFYSTVLISSDFSIQSSLMITLPILSPLLYIMIYFSFSPFVAVFEDGNVIEIFSKSKLISSRKIVLVIINHLFSLFFPILFSMNMMLESMKLKFLSTYYSILFEAAFSILTILTSSKVYFYLLDLE